MNQEGSLLILPIFDQRKFPIHVLRIIQNRDEKIETLLSRVSSEELNNFAKGSLMLRMSAE